MSVTGIIIVLAVVSVRIVFSASTYDLGFCVAMCRWHFGQYVAQCSGGGRHLSICRVGEQSLLRRLVVPTSMVVVTSP